LALLAYFLNRSGKFREESALLKQIRKAVGGEFWSLVQSVYRLSVPLPDLCKSIGDMCMLDTVEPVAASKINLWFYPDYSQGNEYQNLLYETLKSDGANVQGVNDFRTLSSLNPSRMARTIVHIHWVNAIFKDVGQGDFKLRAREFLESVAALKGKGIEVYWTIHNEISHESIDAAEERKFRSSLAEIVDGVYVHHPMILDLIDWLPDGVRVKLVEHGGYRANLMAPGAREAARRSLGLEDDDVALICIGQIRSYKALAENLPAVLDEMRLNSKLKLILVGKVVDPAVKDILSECHGDRILLKDRFVPKEELDLYLQAADFGFLSYRSILTSGSMFHMLSFGLPVIAPRLGSIPAYIVNGWNGFVYGSRDELSRRIAEVGSISCVARDRMRANALASARSVSWSLVI
jgi:glycosyltransferase involved in cell wall biosynthesis